MRKALRISLFALLAFALFRAAYGQVSISVSFAPPALPLYEQPPCPEDGWMWVPGFWAWDDDEQDYYWVPGSWVAAPQPGLFWTPAWWGWENGAFIFHDGFWAPEVGWYGGINYGFGYFGHGFYGGRWDHDRFFYNTAVVHVNETVIRNVYVDKTVIRNETIVDNHVSYNGGEGGVTARPTAQEERVAQGRRFPPVQAQEQRRQLARSNPQMRASANQGRPPIAATARPTEFKGSGVVAARQAGAPYHPPANRPSGSVPPRPASGSESATPTHARAVQPHQPTPSTEENNANSKYQKQQQKQIEQQNKEHQRLQQQQEKEDQRAQQQKWNDQKRQQMEQRHQQQTQQMEQHHQQQQEKMQPPPAARPAQRPDERSPH